jgi:hypothetical protein
MAMAKGPIFAAGGFQAFSSKGYTLLFLPDIANEDLQRENKAPVYYWLPNKVRLARKDGDTGDYVFSFIHFEGVLSSETNIAVGADKNEVSGGVFAFSTTTAPPTDALKEIQDQLLNAFKGKDDRYWGWRTSVAPEFRPVPIVANVTTVSNVSPSTDGTVPAVVPPGGGGGAVGAGGGGAVGAGGGGALPPAGGGAPAGSGTPAPAGGSAGTAPAGGGSSGAAPSGGAPGSTSGGAPGAGSGAPPGRAYNPSLPPVIRAVRRLPTEPTRSRGTVPVGYRPSNLDPFYLRVDGQGPGSVSPFAENAYSAVCGGLEAGILWNSFHQGTSVITIHQFMRLKVVSPEVTLTIHGDWDRIQAHFSAQAHYGALFYSGDIQAQFNYLREQGDIKVTLFVDTTLPNADKLQEAMEKRSDLVFQKFMDLAQKVIFDPAPFNEKPAEASGGFLGFGGGVAMKLRADMSHLTLNYEETRQYAYFQDYPISGDLAGIYDEIKADPENEKKYFMTFYVGDWDRKVSRVFKPVCNWPDPGKKWVGEPVAFLSAQVGYPNTNGEINWDSHVFQPGDPPDAQWNSVTEMKKAADVANPPAGWTPDKTFIKRQIHFTEPPSADEYPFARVSVEQNVVDLDPGDYGTLMTDNNLDVRVDNVGMLSVGPIDLDVDLEEAKQEVEIEMQAMGKKADGNDREVVRFRWSFEDQTESRHWMIFTGQADFVPKYKYRVTVTVKGTLFNKGVSWQGDWVEAGGNGPILLRVPMQNDPGVVTRALPVPVYSRPALPGRIPPGRRIPPPRPSPAPMVMSATGSGRIPPGKRDLPATAIGGWSILPPGATPRGVPLMRGNGGEKQMFSGFVTSPPRV